MAPHRPVSGIAVFIMRPKGSFLIGRRLGSHGHQTWGLPGGHLEYKESFEECAARETLEETGLETQNAKFLTTTNDFHQKEGRHGVTMFMTAELVKADAEAKIMEPTKCGEWRWQNFQPIMEALAKIDEGRSPSEDYFLPLYNLIRQRPEAAERLGKWD